MIDWKTVSKPDTRVIQNIVKRALPNLLQHGVAVTSYDLEMDVTAAHITCPLDLQKLLDADDLNFFHDICGIRAHLDRTTGELTDCFLPRFALPVAA